MRIGLSILGIAFTFLPATRIYWDIMGINEDVPRNDFCGFLLGFTDGMISAESYHPVNSLGCGVSPPFVKHHSWRNQNAFSTSCMFTPGIVIAIFNGLVEGKIQRKPSIFPSTRGLSG
jgi:hypothetical protein